MIDLQAIIRAATPIGSRATFRQPPRMIEPRPAPPPEPDCEERGMGRPKGVRTNNWTDADHDRLVELRAEGTPVRQIAGIMGRTEASVVSALARFGLTQGSTRKRVLVPAKFRQPQPEGECRALFMALTEVVAEGWRLHPAGLLDPLRKDHLHTAARKALILLAITKGRLRLTQEAVAAYLGKADGTSVRHALRGRFGARGLLENNPAWRERYLAVFGMAAERGLLKS